jgi:D-alanyl-lipoteichoic acid acyltransferase DltB (MBOAT superfamily)
VNAFDIDLGAPFYWAFLGIAAIVLTPLARRAPRRAVLAAVDILFIALLTAPWGGVAAAAYAFILHGIASIAQHAKHKDRPAVRTAALTTGGAMVLSLFLSHKLGLRSEGIAPMPIALRLLVAVGYSYVALRPVELLRAGADDVLASTDGLDAIAYLFPLHMLAAGPIQAWTDFTRARGEPAPLNISVVLDAIDRIVHGLFKKFVLARVIELALLTRFTAPWGYQILEVQAYYLWVYLDFSAYSDLAIGAGRLLGVATPENFNRPLGARNIIVFWERWHMSLSSFVRRNLFIPLQLNMMRRSAGGHALAIASVAFAASFLLIGLWHELSLRFLLWGAMHAAAVIVCNIYRRTAVPAISRRGGAPFLESRTYQLISMLITFEFVAFSLAFIVHPATAFLE